MRLPYYEPVEIRTRSDVIIVKSGLSRNVDRRHKH